jgi:hypothetical protein
MFRRLLVEEWQAALTIVSFVIFFTVFAATLIRCWLMPRAYSDRMEHLPLEKETRDE